MKNEGPKYKKTSKSPFLKKRLKPLTADYKITTNRLGGGGCGY
jgi:hypothetical protein